MKFLYYLALIVLMSASQIKEIEMATVRRNLPMQDQRRMPIAAKKPPAWLGRNAGGFGGGVGGGLGQNYTPANPNWQEPLSNVYEDRPQKDDPVTGMNMNNMLPGGSGANTPVPALPWLPSLAPTRGPAYGGSYNPTNMVLKDGQWNVPQWMGGDAEVRDIEQIADEVWNPPAPPVPTYPISQGHPGGGVPVWMMPPPEEPTSGGGGMSTSYGGNWRRGGGGYGGGYGGGGAPAWLPNMGLNSWVFRG